LSLSNRRLVSLSNRRLVELVETLSTPSPKLSPLPRSGGAPVPPMPQIVGTLAVVREFPGGPTIAPTPDPPGQGRPHSASPFRSRLVARGESPTDDWARRNHHLGETQVVSTSSTDASA